MEDNIKYNNTDEFFQEVEGHIEKSHPIHF